LQRLSHRPLSRARRGRREDSLLVISGEGSLFDLGSSLVEGIHLPLFEKHFGVVQPRPILEESLRHLALRTRFRGAGKYRLLSALLDLLSRHPRVLKPDPLWKKTSLAIDSWLGTAPFSASLSLERIVASRGELGRLLGPVLAWSSALRLCLACLPVQPVWKALKTSMELLPRSTEVAVITGLPTKLVSDSWKRAALLRYPARLWEDRGFQRGPILAAHIGQAASLDESEKTLPARFGEGRVLLVGDAPGDLGLARSLGAVFFPLLRGREEEGWDRLSREILIPFSEGRAFATHGLVGQFLASFTPHRRRGGSDVAQARS
jgi:hypothetical protein